MNQERYRKLLQKKTLKELYKIFWKYFSIVVRNESEFCYTCGAFTEPKQSFAGHYKHEGNSDIWLLKSSRKNIHKQCQRCNYFLHGNLDAYGLRLEAQYGYGILQELEQLRSSTYIPTEEEVIDLIISYKKLAENY